MFELALQFGRYDINTFREELSYKDFVAWQLFYKKEPFGIKREDIRCALIASTMANLWSTKKRYKINDFILDFSPPKPMSWQSIKNALMSMTKDK